MRPSAALADKRDAVRNAVVRFRTTNPRLFGSTLHGVDGDNSDLDILVDAEAGATLFDLGALKEELEHILGVKVDVLTPDDIPKKFRDRVLEEAQPI